MLQHALRYLSLQVTSRKGPKCLFSAICNISSVFGQRQEVWLCKWQQPLAEQFWWVFSGQWVGQTPEMMEKVSRNSQYRGWYEQDDEMTQWSGWVFVSRGCDRAEGRLAWFPLQAHEIREQSGTRLTKEVGRVRKARERCFVGRETKRNCYTSLLKQRCYHLFIHSHFAGSLETFCFEARGVKKITVIFWQIKKISNSRTENKSRLYFRWHCR